MNTSFAIKQMHLISFSASCTCLPGLGSQAWVAKGIVTATLANARRPSVLLVRYWRTWRP